MSKELETLPVVGAAPGIVGSIQAMETLRYRTGSGKLLKDSVSLFDGEEMFFSDVKAARNPDCPACAG